MRKLLAVSALVIAFNASAGEAVVINIPTPVTSTSLPQVVNTPSGSYIIVPNYIRGGVAAVVQTSQARK